MQILPHVSDASVHLATLLGRGRHGTVFRARVDDVVGAGGPIAVKVPHHVERSLEEFDILIRFDHPHIVRVLAEPLTNGSLLLEYCGGGTMADRIEARRFTVAEVRRLLVQLTDALARLHDAGWIHGDVSPNNVVFREDDTPVLIDFTTARPSDAAVVDEGTDEFTGPIRIATPTLDSRALAATALTALGDERSWDRADIRLRTHLEHVVERADNGEAVAIEELLTAGPSCDSETAVAPDPELRTGITRSFGPRPEQLPKPGVDDSVPTARRAAAVLALALAMLAVVGGEWLATRSPNTTPSPMVEATESARSTLRRAAAEWDTTTGTLHVEAPGASVSWHVGVPGDLAAVGDWDCSGTATLGVYRPSTGSWFAFDSWDDGAASHSPLFVGADHTELAVAVDPDGCSSPRLQ